MAIKISPYFFDVIIELTWVIYQNQNQDELTHSYILKYCYITPEVPV